MLNIVLNIELEAEYRALLSEFEYSAEYRPVGPNIELYIRSLNMCQKGKFSWHKGSVGVYS